jgi:hypothetical protein
VNLLLALQEVRDLTKNMHQPLIDFIGKTKTRLNEEVLGLDVLYSTSKDSSYLNLSETNRF